MNVIRDQVSENLRRVLDAPPPGATLSSSSAAAAPVQLQHPRLPLIPANSGALPLQGSVQQSRLSFHLRSVLQFAATAEHSEQVTNG